MMNHGPVVTRVNVPRAHSAHRRRRWNPAPSRGR
jgi:hypothetical protein